MSVAGVLSSHMSLSVQGNVLDGVGRLGDHVGVLFVCMGAACVQSPACALESCLCA